MFSDQLPELEEVKSYYDINFEEYAICMFHPVTTEVDLLKDQIHALKDAMIESGKNYLIIYPNNDHGSSIILDAWKSIESHKQFRILPSLRFEYFLVALKYASFMIGNSSAGVREAPYYGIPSINIGSRQLNRVTSSAVVNVDSNKKEILEAIVNLPEERFEIENTFGTGNSATLFKESLESDSLWNLNHQKQFLDVGPQA